MSHAVVEKSEAQPIGARVLVKIEKKNEPPKSGLFIPDTAKGLPREGLVISVGTGKFNLDGERIPMEVKLGDRVLFGKYVGTEVKVDGEDCIILLYDDIDGIIE